MKQRWLLHVNLLVFMILSFTSEGYEKQIGERGIKLFVGSCMGAILMQRGILPLHAVLL